MKKIVLSMAITTIALINANAQKLDVKDVPGDVKAKFTALYPNETKVKWEKEAGNYEAGFEIKEIETTVLIDPKGNLVQTETKIKISELPKGIDEYVSKNKPGNKIKGAEKIVDPSGVVTYEAEIKGGDLIFDTAGKFIKEMQD